jgi:hypothetical protein
MSLETDARAREFALRVARVARQPIDADYDMVSQICPPDVDREALARVVASFRVWEVLSERERVLAAIELHLKSDQGAMITFGLSGLFAKLRSEP